MLSRFKSLLADLENLRHTYINTWILLTNDKYLLLTLLMTSLMIIGYYISDFYFIIFFFSGRSCQHRRVEVTIGAKRQRNMCFETSSKGNVNVFQKEAKTVIEHITVLDTVAKCKENSFECQITLTENWKTYLEHRITNCQSFTLLPTARWLMYHL